MKLKSTLPSFAVLLLVFILSFTGRPGSSLKSIQTNKGFAVIELFTSEGCSSCPAADQLMATLLSDYKSNVYILSFHVDYWNRLGWNDRFSDASYSERQNQYASVFHLNSIYTPQVVINGLKEFIGSDKKRLYNSINEQLKKENSDDFSISMEQSGNSISVKYKTNAVKNQMLNIALIQSNAETKVMRGENSGRTLLHVQVVRGFKTIFSAGKEGITSFDIPEDLTSKDIGIIAFLQNQKNLQIINAHSAYIK
jgi:hypothetical protein